MIGSMSFVQIVGPRSEFWPAVNIVQDAGVLHVEEVPLAEWDGVGFLHRAQLPDEMLHEQQSYRELVKLLDEETVRHIPKSIRGEFDVSTAHTEQYETWEAKSGEVIAGAVRSLHAEVRSFVRRRKNVEDDLAVLEVYEEVVAALAPLTRSIDSPEDHDVVGVLFESGRPKARTAFSAQVEKLTAGQCQMHEEGLSGGRVAALVSFAKPFAAEVREFIGKMGISEIRGPRYLSKKPFHQVISAVAADLDRLKGERKALRQRIEEFFRTKGSQLMALRGICHDRLNRLDTVANFARTRYTFIMEGWVPTGETAPLCKRLQAQCGPGLSVRNVRAHGAADSPPVALHNPRPTKPFELLLALLPLPRYGTIDPTMFVATFFPPIFGLMLADIGYGLLLVIGAMLLWCKGSTRKIVRALGVVLGCCAFYTIVFGFVFGEFFGTFGHEMGLRPLWRERLELSGPDKSGALLGYLALVVSVGAAHILLGLVLGIINAKRIGHKFMMFEGAARIAGLFGLFFIVGRLAQFLPPVFTSLGVIALVVFLSLTVLASIQNPTHGLMIPLELLGTVGHILSYARIMAVGMASAVLALLANRFGGMIGNVALAAVVVVIVHALNLVLGIVDPTIQGLRLHYVEFFSKFYQAGGRPYSPFKKIGDGT